MSHLVPIILGVAEAAVGVASLVTGDPAGLALITAGAEVVGGTATAIGAATGNSTLEKIGGIVGTAAIVTGGIDSLTGALTDASGVAPTANLANNFAEAASPTADLSALTSESGTIANAADTASLAPAASATAAGAPPDITAGGANANTAANGAINSAGPAAIGAQENAVANSPLAGTPAGPIAPQGLGAVTNPTTPLLQQGESAPTVTPGTLDTVPGKVPGASSGLLGGLKDWYSGLSTTDQLKAVQTGAGILGGVMSYVAPSPLARAQANSLNANMQRLQWEQSLAAAHNTALGSMTPGTPPAGQATWGPQNTPVNGAPTAPQPGGYQPANVSAALNPLAALSQQIGNPNARPGILQSNLAQ
jgi:hypothetical protein